MDDTLHIIAIWVHILGIALFVGPQFFLAFAWAPAARGITDRRLRLQATRTITRRFGIIGGAGLGLILVAGMYLITAWRDYYGVPDSEEFTALRYGVFFIIKMTILLVMLAVVGIHTFVVGPRLIEAMEDQAAGERGADETVQRVRTTSMALSIAGLVLTLVIMVFGVMIGSPGWSLQDI